MVDGRVKIAKLFQNITNVSEKSIKNVALVLITLSCVVFAVVSFMQWRQIKETAFSTLSNQAAMLAIGMDGFFDSYGAVAKHFDLDNLKYDFDGKHQKDIKNRLDYITSSVDSIDGVQVYDKNGKLLFSNSLNKDLPELKYNVFYNSEEAFSIANRINVNNRWLLPIRFPLHNKKMDTKGYLVIYSSMDNLFKKWLEAKVPILNLYSSLTLVAMRNDGVVLFSYPLPKIPSSQLVEFYSQPRSGSLMRSIVENKDNFTGSVYGYRQINDEYHWTQWQRLNKMPAISSASVSNKNLLYIWFGYVAIDLFIWILFVIFLYVSYRNLLFFLRITSENKVLADIDSILSNDDNYSGVLQKILERVVEFNGIHRAWIGHPSKSSLVVIDANVGMEKLVNESMLNMVRVDDTPSGNGSVGQAWRTKQAVTIDDWTHDSRVNPWHEIAVAYDIKSNIAIPIRYHGDVTSILALYSPVVGFFSQKDTKELIKKITTAVEIAIEKNIDWQSMLKAEQMYEAIVSVEATMLNEESEEKLFKNISDKLMATGLFSFVGIALPNVANTLRYVYMSGDAVKSVEAIQDQLEAYEPFSINAEKAYYLGMPVIVNDIDNDPAMPEWTDAIHILIRENAWNSEALFQILKNKSIYAVLALKSHKKDIFDTKMQNLGLRLAELVSFAIDAIYLKKQLLSEQNKQKNLLKSIGSGLYGIDRNGLCVFINDPALLMLGFNRSEVLGQSAHALFHYKKFDGSENTQEECSVKDTLAYGRRINSEDWFVKKDGSMLPVELISSPILDGTTVAGAIVSFTDTTEKRLLLKQISEEKEFANNVIESANAIVAVIDKDGTMTRVNKYTENFTGYTEKEIASEPYFWARFIPKAFRDKVISVFEESKTGKIKNRYENKWVSKDGTEITFDWSNTLITNDKGEMDYLVTIGYDIEDKKKYIDEIQLSEKFKTALMDNSAVCIFLATGDRKIYYANKRGLDLFGYTDEEVVGKSFRIIHVNDELFELFGHEYTKFKVGGIINANYPFVKKDGSIVHCSVNGAPLDPTDLDKGVIWSLLDITEQYNLNKALEESEERLNKLFHNHDTVFLLIDPSSGNILDANEKASEFYGYTTQELTNMNISHINTLSEEEVKARMDDAKLNETHSFVFEHKLKSGEIRNVEVHSSSINTKQGELLFSIVFDVTERKLMEQGIIKAKEVAEAATKAKSEFLANMSHEIRTPMNAIMGLTQVVLGTKLNAVQKDYLTKVDSASKTLMHLLNDILDYSKVEAGKLELYEKEFSPEEAIRSVLSLFGNEIAKKKLGIYLDLAGDIPNQVLGDELRVVQILNNLLSNAIKFTESGDIHIGLDILSSYENRQILRFFVKDSGIGMSEEETERLFEAFVQADTSITRKYGGTGLGLAICKRLVSMMNGDISVSSKKDEGSVFEFTIEVGAVGKADIKKERASAVGGKKVYIVSKDEKTSKILLKILNSWRCVVDLDVSLEHALSKKNIASYDLLLFDLSDFDGDIASTQKLIHNANSHVGFLISFGKKIPNELSGTTLVKPAYPSQIFELLSSNDMQTKRDAKIDDTPIAKSMSVLLVEDNELNQVVALAMLSKIGIQSVEVANNGIEAVKMSGAKSYDLILMDMHMPEMDGLEATSKIRQIDGRQKTPILAMTAAVMQDDIDACMASGMNGFLSKPISIKELKKAILEFVASDENESKTAIEAITTKQDENMEAIIDLSNMQAFFGDDAESINEFMQKFVTNNTETLIKLQKTLADGDMKAASILAHSVKGNSSYLGAKALTEIAAKLEHELKDGSYDKNTVMSFNDELQKTIAAVNTLIKHSKDDEKPVLEASEEDIDRMISVLTSIDVKAKGHKYIDKAQIEEFKKSVVPFVEKELSGELLAAIENMDSVNSSKLCESLIKQFRK